MKYWALDTFKLIVSDIKICTWLWHLYLKYFLRQRRCEGKELFSSSFKDYKEYSQICYEFIHKEPALVNPKAGSAFLGLSLDFLLLIGKQDRIC